MLASRGTHAASLRPRSLPSRVPASARTLQPRSRPLSVCTMASTKVYVKADPATHTLGDCPFCHRVLLTLERKGLPYEMEFIDFNNKPQWLVDKAGGKVPVLQQDGTLLPDSDKIVELLEQQAPQPSMVAHVPADVVGGFFGAFRGLVMCKPEEAAEKKAAFVAEAKKVDGYLASQPGPLFGGSDLDAADAAFAPKLYHAIVALQHYKGWDFEAAGVADQFPALAAYWRAVQELPAWRNTLYPPSSIISGWARHMA